MRAVKDMDSPPLAAPSPAKERFRLTVNGSSIERDVAPDASLLDFVRDDLDLTGAKRGCDVGVCGSCTVILNGRAVRSCILKMSECRDSAVETIENLAKNGELHPLQKAFIERAGTQCGYSTPGMIMAAKALLDKNANPTEEDIKKALAGNICRCTGYQQILESVRQAAGNLQEAEVAKRWKFVPERKEELRIVGKSFGNVRAKENVTGATRYGADVKMEGMLHGWTVRAPAPHGEIVSIDTSGAEKVPGVVRVLTHKDIPGENIFGKKHRDQPVLCDKKFRYIGDAIAVVVAERRDIARKAAELVRVEWRSLPLVANPVEALSEGAAKVHEQGNLLYHFKIRKGDVERGFAESDVVVERWYQTPHQEHAQMEPEISLAYFDDDGKLVVKSPTQHVYFDRVNIFRALGMPKDDVRSIQTPVGGAFGNREDVYGQIHAALATLHTRRPVMIEYTREDTFTVTQKRHPVYIRLKTGAKKDGTVVAFEAEIYGDAGAYASWSENVMRKSGVHVSGTYEIENVKVDSRAVYTNNIFTGAMRGFGTTNTEFCTERHMDEVADALGMDPLAFRMKNAFRDGSRTATRQEVKKGGAVRRTMEAAQKEFGWEKWKPPADLPPYLKRGIGMANCWYGIGFGCGIPDRGDAIMEMHADGTASIWVSTTDYGQGSDTIFRQIAAETLGLRMTDVNLTTGDTATTPNCGSTVASRQTYITGNAIWNTSRVLANDMKEIAGKLMGVPASEITFGDRVAVHTNGKKREIPIAEIARKFEEFGKPRRRETIFKGDNFTNPLHPETGEGNAYHPYAMGTNMCEVEVDTRNGKVKLIRMVAAHHVGRALNPLAVRGQIVGGISMGIGFAFMEELDVQACVPRNQNFDKYQMMRARDLPSESLISIIVEDDEATGPFGAIGVGEPPTIPVAPAILNAIKSAVGVRFFTPPATSRRILAALKGEAVKPDGSGWALPR